MSEQSRTLARQLQRFHRTGHTNTAEITDEDLRYARLIAPNPDVVEYELEDLYPIQWLQRRNFNAFLIGWQSRYTSFRDRPQRITARPRFSAQQPQISAQISAQTHVPVQQTSENRARELLASPFRRPRIGYIDFGSGTRQRSNSDSTPQRLLTEGSSQTPAPEVESPTYEPRSPTLSISFQFEPRGHESTDESSSFIEDPTSEASEPERGRNDMAPGGTNGGLNPEGNPNPNPQPLTIADATQLLITGLRQQGTDIRTSVADVVAEAFARHRVAAPAEGDGGGGRTVTLKPDDVGYFNPTTRNPDGTGITSSGKVTIFTDVYAFTERLKHLKETRGELAVKEVWTTCLQSTALNWHATELTNLERTALSQGTVDLVCSTLENHFKRNPSEALQSLQAKKFTLLDIRHGKTMRPFVQGVVKDAKACGLPESTQLIWAFEACDSQIQAIIGKPQPTDSLGHFLVEVDRQESVLQARARELYPFVGGQQSAPPQPVSAYGYAQPQGRYPPQQYNQFNSFRGGYNNNYRGRGRGNFANQQWRNQYNNWDQNRYPPNNQYPNQQNFRGGHNNQNYGQGQQRNNQGQNQNQGAPQQQWNSNQNRQDNRPPPGPGNQNRDNRFYQQNRGQQQRAYYTNEFETEDSQQYAGDESQQYDHYGPPNYDSWNYESPPPDADMNPSAFEQHDQSDPSGDQEPEHFAPAYFATASQSPVMHDCRHCGKSFTSRNILFRHLNTEHHTPIRAKSKKTETETALNADHQRMNLSSLLVPPKQQGLIAVTAPTQSGPTGTEEPTRQQKKVSFADHPSAPHTPVAHHPYAASPPSVAHHPSAPHTPASDPLHTHHPFTTLRTNADHPSIRKTPSSLESTEPIVIRSTVNSKTDTGTGFGFRTWTYLKFFITPDIGTGTQHSTCGDTGCSKSLGDRQWVSVNYPNLQIRKRSQPLTVRGIGNDYHQTSDYVVMPMYFKGTSAQGKPAYAFFEREVALVSGLQANMLLGMDILGPELFDILNSKGHATIGSCAVTIPMEAGVRGRQQRSVVKTTEHTVVPARSYHQLAIEHNLKDDGQDFLFDPAPWNRFTAFALLADASVSQIIIRNDSEAPITIPKGARVGHLDSMDPRSSCMHLRSEPGSPDGDEPVPHASDAPDLEELAADRPPAQPKERIVPDMHMILNSTKTIKHSSGITIYDTEDRHTS